MSKDAPLSALAKRHEAETDWTEAEEALRQIEGGIAVLYGLWDSATHSGCVDAAGIGRALFFTAHQMGRELQRAQKALRYHAGGKEPEGGTNG